MKSLPIGLLFVSALACDGAARPSDPVWGKQPCDACKMIVSEPRPAAQLITATDERLYFDDLGCLVVRVHDEKLPPRAMWVRSAAGPWIDARAARFARGQATPMDYGFLAAEGGELDFTTVEREILARAAARRSE